MPELKNGETQEKNFLLFTLDRKNSIIHLY